MRSKQARVASLLEGTAKTAALISAASAIAASSTVCRVKARLVGKEGSGQAMDTGADASFVPHSIP